MPLFYNLGLMAEYIADRKYKAYLVMSVGDPQCKDVRSVAQELYSMSTARRMKLAIFVVRASASDTCPASSDTPKVSDEPPVIAVYDQIGNLLTTRGTIEDPESLLKAISELT